MAPSPSSSQGPSDQGYWNAWMRIASLQQDFVNTLDALVNSTGADCILSGHTHAHLFILLLSANRRMLQSKQSKSVPDLKGLSSGQ